MNCDVIATIQSVFMNTLTGSISEIVDVKLSITLDTLTARILKLSSDSQS